MDPVVTRFFYIGLVCTIIACVVLLSCLLIGLVVLALKLHAVISKACDILRDNWKDYE